MLSALLSLVASMGALSVLAGVVSGVIFLVDTALHWGSAQKNWPNVPGGRALPALSAVAANGNGTARHEANGLANGKAVGLTAEAGLLALLPPSPVRVALPTLQTLSAPLAPLGALRTPRIARSGAGDGESQCDMGEADDVPDDVPDGVHDEVPGVRQLMERLVESLVSGGLDDVELRPKDPHPQYGRIYKRHQPRLRSALTSLAYSLQMAMAQKPLAESETPGRAHAQLRAIILDLARDVAALDRHPGHAAMGRGDAKADVMDGKEDFATRAYEDILATAIVNKVMERSTSKNNKRNNNNNNNFVSSLEVRVGSVEDSPESCTSSYTESWTGSGRGSGLGSGSSHLDHSLEDLDSDPLSLMIEECIEEVTTITASSSPSASSSSLDERSDGSEGEEAVREAPVVRRRRRVRSVRGGGGVRRRGSGVGSASAQLPLPPSGPPSLLAGLSFLKQRVPFPELGVDIVDADWSSGDSELSDADATAELADGSDGGSGAEGWRPRPAPRPAPRQPDGAEAGEGVARADGDPKDDEERPASCLELVTPLQSWEDNWLFQSKRSRKPAAQYAHHPVPVPMLVPNPSEDLRPLIGDVDAEETSDLSECSDDALEEVVLAGLRPGATANGNGTASPDQFSEDLSLSESSMRPHQDGLAETCNLELLRRVVPTAPTLSTAPAPRAQRTDRSANLGSPVATPDRLSPVNGKASSRASSRTSSRASSGTASSPLATAGTAHAASARRHSPVDLAGRWARDQDAEMTIVYDTPAMREAPTREAHEAPVKARSAPKQAAPRGAPAVRPRGAAAAPPSTSTPPAALPEAEKTATDAAAAAAFDATTDRSMPTLAGEAEGPDGEPSEPQAREAVAVNGHASPARPASPASSAADSLDDVDLSTPPRPGTIAEREHRKWLEATPLANNPYSPENIQRRLQQRASLTGMQGLPGSPLPPTATNGEHPRPAHDTSLHIALRVDPDPKKYGRDFYINSRGSGQPNSGLRRTHSSTVADRRNGQSDAPPAALAPIAPWSSTVRTNGDGGSEDSSPQPTPSVKELAKQFLAQPQEQPPPPGPIPQARARTESAKVVIVGKESKDAVEDTVAAAPAPVVAKQDRKAVRQVHSLTARSMSREFREGLRHLSTPTRPAGPPASAVSTTTPQQPAASSATASAAASATGQDAAQPNDQGHARPDPEGARQPADPE